VTMRQGKRRSPGEGSVWPYRERNGTERWAIGHPSFGTRRRGPNGEKWYTKKAAQEALQLARDSALVFGGIEGRHRNPEHVSRQFARDVARCREALGADVVPVIRLHDLHHTHATLLLAKGVPVKVVSERLGHASPTITLGVYAHVMSGNQREAADLFARLIGEA